MMDLSAKIKEIEEIIYQYLPETQDKQAEMVEAMNYSVKVGGKRLRPMLIQETAKLFSADVKDAEPFMAAIECIHTYSLVHDDLPAMDNDDFRRGQLTTHKKYGHAAGILAGDGLLNYAYEICADAVLCAKDTLKAAKAMKIIADCAGIFGMVGGQAVDVALTGKPLDEDTLEFIYVLKTGALIKASMVAGAIIGGADEEETAIIEKISVLIGRAFQIQDDILDITSTTEVLGKPVFSDAKNDKTTYVTLYGLNAAEKEVKRLTDEATELLMTLPGDKRFLCDLFEILVNRKK
ncbi:MAG: polyprenyl synthetase family protein [Lachnospiraceae bacterium]|nr:polyprenyl synthetase family protein [Lachnospiraceae bacterium]